MKHTAKKTLSLLLALVMMFSLLPGRSATAYAATTYDAGDLAYSEIVGLLIKTGDTINVGREPFFDGYQYTGACFTIAGSTNDVTDSTAEWTADKDYSIVSTDVGKYDSWNGELADVYWYRINLAPFVAVTDVTLQQGENAVSELALTVGDTAPLTAVVAPNTASNQTVTWTSSNANVATVANGVVSAVGAGSATITATATNGTDTTEDDQTATVTVTVNAPAPATATNVTGVTLKEGENAVNQLELTVGDALTLTATVTPDDATDKTVTWSSSNADVATVNENGVITAVAAGEATITATATNGTADETDDKTATCAVNVSNPVITHTHDGVTFETAWTSTNSLPNNAGSYYLTEDVTLSKAAWEVPGGGVRLCLNGHTIRRNLSAATNTGYVIVVDSGNSLELYDCGTTGTVTGGNNYPTKTTTGGGVFVNGGSFTLYGGAITGNKAPSGGGVYVSGSSSVFTMEGGSISGSESTTSDGTVASGGGGVGIYNGGRFVMNGGSITGNSANGYGGGVGVKTGFFTLSGGSITGNTAIKNGGGVMQRSDLTLSGGTIIDNTKGGEANNLYLGSSKIAVTGNLTGSKIGIGRQTGTFTSSYNSTNSGLDPATVFTSDNLAYVISLTTAGEAQLALKVAVESVTLNEETLELTVEDTATLTPTIQPDTATDKTVTWTSSDVSVATVNENGVVTAVAAGEATITATATNGTDTTDDDKTATVTVTVNAPAPTTYTVTWKNGDTVLKTDTVEEGNAPAYTGTTPEKAADTENTYTFSGWSDGTNTYGATGTLPAVTADVTYTATFAATAKVTAATSYTVTFSANENTVTKEVTTLPYTFSCDFDNENGELDEIIKTLYGVSGGSCALALPSSSGSSSVTAGLNGNNQEITVDAPFDGTATVTGEYFNFGSGSFFYSLDITCQAVVAAPTYTVTWLNWNETELEKDEGVAEGATPSFDGVPPTLTGAYATYTFSGWSPEPANVTADASYTALFDETLNDGVYTSEVSYIYSNVEISNVDVFSEQLSEDDLVQVMTDLQNGKIVAVYGELTATGEPVAAVYDLAGYDYTFYDHNGNKLEGQAQKTTVPTTNFGYDSEFSLNFTTLPVANPSDVYAVYVEATTAPAVPNFYSKDDVAELIVGKTAPENNDPATKDNDTLFLGWYKDEACTQPITSADDVPEGGAYAKFIPTKSLGLLVQFRKPAKSGQANKTDLRLIATVPDPSLYQEIGFEVKTDRTGEMKLLIDKHYSDNIYSGFVTQTINGVTSRYTVEDALKDHVGDAQWSKYITSLNLNNMPNSLYLDQTTNFEVKQYIITKDGTRAEIGVKEFAITHDNKNEPTLAE